MTAIDPDRAVRFVLVGTSHPGNIGSAARAMKTMAFRRMALVAPVGDPLDREAMAMAAGADDLIDQAWRGDVLDDALTGCTLVLGSTARRRSVPMPELSPRDAASRVVEELARGGQVALLFGRERTGLENDELQRCHAAIHIPTDVEFSSLNLASAVQVLAYELRVALLQAAAAGRPAEGEEGRDPPATHEQMEGLFQHLDTTLKAIDFHKGRAPDTVMHRLRRLFLRAVPDTREVRILHGILADAERMAMLAGRAQSGGLASE